MKQIEDLKLLLQSLLKTENLEEPVEDSIIKLISYCNKEILKNKH